MKLPRQLDTLAKMLAYILGHRPDEFGLVLDADGFVSLQQLQQVLIHEPGWGFVRRHHLDQVVLLMQPPAFEVLEDKIRCLQPGPLPQRRPGEAPPALLYLALPPKAHERVWQEGLKAPVSGELLLARTKETALKLGKRRAPAPIMVTIQAQAAAQTGIAFTGYGEEFFLTQSLPRDFLQMPAPLVQQEKPKAPKAAPAPPTPGTFLIDLSQPTGKPPRPRGKKAEPAWKAGTRA
ncbi:MAG: RNA 2'-phosphotransferase, partial [Deltaproteobacteria bacterium]|nr:RNA 2'-phosphotransferase [Deltaproteobacteria bacterium]